MSNSQYFLPGTKRALYPMQKTETGQHDATRLEKCYVNPKVMTEGIVQTIFAHPAFTGLQITVSWLNENVLPIYEV